MPAKSKHSPPAFTLVELILVMALLVVFLAISAPSISHSFTRQALKQEATRLLALTEYARNEAVSQGVPMVVWIDSQSQSFGVRAKSGYDSSPTRGASRTAGLPENDVPSREKEYTLAEGMHFDLNGAKAGRDGQVILAELAPDGTPDVSSLASVQIVDRNDKVMELTLADDGWGYEIGEDQ